MAKFYCELCHKHIKDAIYKASGDRFCSMEHLNAYTGGRNKGIEPGCPPMMGGQRGFDSYHDHIMGKTITSWGQQEKALKEFNANPLNKEKRSFFNDNHKAVAEAKYAQKHKGELSEATYKSEGIKYKHNPKKEVRWNEKHQDFTPTNPA